VSHCRALTFARALVFSLACGGLAGLTATSARAEALLLVEADSGKVLHAENAAFPWYPASVTKLMTAYVTLKAVRERRISLSTLLTVSPTALAQQPSKMGFPVGSQVTVDDALKMLMVKSANDMAVVLAEGVSGSIEAFSTEMNNASARLGMTQSSWVNPNGLPADGQITSARDMAILARTIYRELPEYEMYWRISAIKFGRRVMRNYNKLIDRYPGADGMKTGFICASGFNLVASATRNGKRVIAVVLGAPSSAERAETAARLLEKGFTGGNGLNWLMPSLGTVDALQPIAAAPPNLRDEICGKNRKRPRTDHGEEEEQPAGAAVDSGSAAYAAIVPNFRTAAGGASLLGPLIPSMPPIPVTVIPPKKAPGEPEVTPEQFADKMTTAPAKKPGRKTAVIKVGDKGKPAATAEAKPEAAVAKPVKPPAKPHPTAAAPVKPPAKPAVAKPAAPVKPKPAAAAIGSKPIAAAEPKPRAQP
jgi:D-alanyl-D-alanine carboxypeptidase